MKQRKFSKKQVSMFFTAGPAEELDKQELAFLADFVQVMVCQSKQLECYAAVTFCNW